MPDAVGLRCSSWATARTRATSGHVRMAWMPTARSRLERWPSVVVESCGGRLDGGALAVRDAFGRPQSTSRSVDDCCWLRAAEDRSDRLLPPACRFGSASSACSPFVRVLHARGRHRPTPGTTARRSGRRHDRARDAVVAAAGLTFSASAPQRFDRINARSEAGAEIEFRPQRLPRRIARRWSVAAE